MIEETDTNIKLTISLNKHTNTLSIWLNDVLAEYYHLKSCDIKIHDTLTFIGHLMLDNSWFTENQLKYLKKFERLESE